MMVCSLACVSTHAQQSSPAPANRSESIHQIFVEDQEDIPGAANGISKLSPEEYEARLQARKAKVHAMLAAGELKTGQDFEDASFIFQHEDNTADSLMAHVLAMEAVIRGDDRAKWIAAATLDRYLQSVHQPQVFGTQYPLDPNLPHTVASGNARFLTGRTLQPYNEQFLPDPIRFDFCVPSLDQQRKNVAMFNAGQRPFATMRAPGCRH